MALANGKATSRNAKPVTDLKLAVTRVGPDNVRSAALPYVLDKLRLAQAHEHIHQDLVELWERSTLVAAIAHNWGLPDGIADAIGDQDQLDRHDAGARDLTDVLCVAVRSASFFGQPDELEIALGSLPLFRRLGLDRDTLHQVMDAAAKEISGLRSALGL